MTAPIQTTTHKIVNGIDVTRFLGTLDAIRNDAEIADFHFRAVNKWDDGGHNVTTISGFYGAKEEQKRERDFVLHEDEPPVLLGTDIGPNPVEYLLAGLAGCVTSSLVYNAAARGIELRHVESRLEGDIDLRGFLALSPDVKVGYQEIRMYFTIDADISDHEKAKLLEYAKDHSPVASTINTATPVKVFLAG